MVTEKVFTDLVLSAGETSEGVMVDLATLGAAGHFGLEVESDTAVKLFYKASCENTVPGLVDGGGVLCEHDGSGKKVYSAIIGAFGKIWIYAEDMSGGGTVSATLNIW